jgi:Ni/Fe-hydrogenase subunit HybB-like protein
MQASVWCGSKRQEGGARLRSVLTAGWLLGICLTAAMGLIHLQVWLDGYRQIPVIGPLFIVNAICSGALVAVLLTVPARLRGLAAIVTALFTAGTLMGLVLSLTVGLFGMHEVLQAPFVVITLVVETAGVIVLLLTAALHHRRQRDQ